MIASGLIAVTALRGIKPADQIKSGQVETCRSALLPCGCSALGEPKPALSFTAPSARRSPLRRDNTAPRYASLRRRTASVPPERPPLPPPRQPSPPRQWRHRGAPARRAQGTQAEPHPPPPLPRG